MKTTVISLALGLLTATTALAQSQANLTRPNPNANRDIRVVTQFLASLTEDQPNYAYTAHGAVVKADETFTAVNDLRPAPVRPPRGFTNVHYHFKSAESVVATGENAGVWVGLWGTWTGTDANQKTLRLPFRHLARLEAGRIVELHTARGEDGEGRGWWREPLFGDGSIRLVPKQ